MFIQIILKMGDYMKSYESFWEKSISDIFQNLKWQESDLKNKKS